MIAEMTREIKNKGPQHQVGTSASYAAVAARGVTAMGIHNAQSVKLPPAPVPREIIIHVKNPQTIQNLRAMNPRNLKTHIDRAIEQSENEHINRIRIMTANQLKSGDLNIRTTTNEETQILRQFTDDWVPHVGNGTAVRNPTYGVLVHGVHTSTMDMERFEYIKHNILPFIPNAGIKYIGWLTKQAPKKAMSSVIIEFTKAEDANKIIDEGLAWDNQLCQCERYERRCRLKQCFQCQKYGHIGTQCKATRACGYCAQEHGTRDCPTRHDQDATRKCVICRGNHEAWSQQCPARIEELARTKAAYEDRPKYHPTVDNRDPVAQGTTREPLRRTRSARNLANQRRTGSSRPGSPQGRGQKRAAPADKENEPPHSSQRPQRTITRTRKLLEHIECDVTADGHDRHMDIDTEEES